MSEIQKSEIESTHNSESIESTNIEENLFERESYTSKKSQCEEIKQKHTNTDVDLTNEERILESFEEIKEKFQEFKEKNVKEFLKHYILPLNEQEKKNMELDKMPGATDLEKFLGLGVKNQLQNIVRGKKMTGIKPPGADPIKMVQSIMIHMTLLEQTIGRYSLLLKGHGKKPYNILLFMEQLLHENLEKIENRCSKYGQNDFINIFSAFKYFVLPFADKKHPNVKNQAEMILKLFHKKFMDKRWLMIGKDGLPILQKDGNYYIESQEKPKNMDNAIKTPSDKINWKKNEKKIIVNAWKYLMLRNTISNGQKVYTGKTYNVFGKISKRSYFAAKVYKIFINIFTKYPADIDTIKPTVDDSWKDFFTIGNQNSPLENNEKELQIIRKQMLARLDFMKNFEKYGFTTSNFIGKETADLRARNYSLSIGDVLKSIVKMINFIITPPNNQLYVPSSWTRYYNLLRGKAEKISHLEFLIFAARIKQLSFLFGLEQKTALHTIDEFIEQQILQIQSGNLKTHFLDTNLTFNLSLKKSYGEIIQQMIKIPKFYSQWFNALGSQIADKNITHTKKNQYSNRSPGGKSKWGQIQRLKIFDENGHHISTLSKLDSNEEVETFVTILKIFGTIMTTRKKVIAKIKPLYIPIVKNIMGENQIYNKIKNKDNRPHWATLQKKHNNLKENAYKNLSANDRNYVRKLLKFTYLNENLLKIREYKVKLNKTDEEISHLTNCERSPHPLGWG